MMFICQFLQIKKENSYNAFSLKHEGCNTLRKKSQWHVSPKKNTPYKTQWHVPAMVNLCGKGNFIVLFWWLMMMIFTESSYFTWDDSVLKFDLRLAQWLVSQHVSALSFTWPALGCSRYLRARYVHQSPNTWHHDIISWPLIIRSPTTKSCYWTIYQGRCWCLQLIIS